MKKSTSQRGGFFCLGRTLKRLAKRLMKRYLEHQVEQLIERISERFSSLETEPFCDCISSFVGAYPP